jgi:DNA-binding NtrC family response regulator
MARERVLLVDDEPNILGTLRRALELEDYRVDVAGDGGAAAAKLAEGRYDAVMLDVALPGKSGLEILRDIAAAYPGLPVLMMSGNATLEVAVEAVRLGAVDFLEKPIGTDKLLITLANALRLARLERDAADAHKRLVRDLEMIGGGARMKALGELIRRAAPSNARVLITGERGTGKELVARAVHAASKRKDAPFVKLNCAAIPSELIESELFGHEKGAFTGATKERAGKFELADGGTLFLDEIGDLAGSAQAKVLRALQEGEIERVGGSAPLRVDVRVLAATNKDLRATIARDQFRADLFDRLNVIPIELPPLRERKEDIPSMLEAFVERACKDNERPRAKITDAAIGLLLQHDWPGNVRELKNLVERLCILAEPRMPSGPALIDEDEVRGALPHLRAARVRLERGRALKDQLLAAEREIIQAAIDAHAGQMAAAARELGLERSHLYKKVRALGIIRPSEDDSAEGDPSDPGDPGDGGASA